MVSIAERNIKGRSYLYADYSFRLPDGSVKKVSKRIGTRADAKSKEIKEHFAQKELELFQRHALATYRPDSVMPSDTLAKVEAYRVEYRRILSNLAATQFKDVVDRFTVNFTYESNAIEGNSLTLKDVAIVLMEGRVPAGKDLREVYETRNTREANELLFRRKIKVTVKGILQLHALLMRDTGVHPGFKRIPNFLLMRDVETAPPEETAREIEKLVAWYRNTDDHPLRLAAEFHGRFERIHPFEDGNGRVGRILINAILLEHSYPPLIVRKTSRTAYLAALEAHDNGFKTKLERFLLEKFEDTFEKFFKVYVKYL